MLISDLEHDHFVGFIKTAVAEALKEALPVALLAHERQLYRRLGMTVDVMFYGPAESGDGYVMVQSLSQLPQCPPLPDEGETYMFRKDHDSVPQHFIVDKIIRSYKYITYESCPGIPEVITEITVYLKRR